MPIRQCENGHVTGQRTCTFCGSKNVHKVVLPSPGATRLERTKEYRNYIKQLRKSTYVGSTHRRSIGSV